MIGVGNHVCKESSIGGVEVSEEYTSALNTGVAEESLRMVSSTPLGNEQLSDEELRPRALEG